MMRSARRARLLSLVALLLAVTAGCAREREAAVPVECQAGRAAIRSALRRAPAPVRVEGVALSECFTISSDTADIAAVGEEYLAVASALAEGARRRPGGGEALRLGYLLGAVRRGAARTQGVNDEMLRRIEQELLAIDARTRAFREGERAGRRSG